MCVCVGVCVGGLCVASLLHPEQQQQLQLFDGEFGSWKTIQSCVLCRAEREKEKSQYSSEYWEILSHTLSLLWVGFIWEEKLCPSRRKSRSLQVISGCNSLSKCSFATNVFDNKNKHQDPLIIIFLYHQGAPESLIGLEKYHFPCLKKHLKNPIIIIIMQILSHLKKNFKCAFLKTIRCLHRYLFWAKFILNNKTLTHFSSQNLIHFQTSDFL